MSHPDRTRSLTLLGLSTTLTLFVTLGCHGGPPPPPLPSADDIAKQAANAPPVDPNAPTGAKVYAAMGCATCHMIEGEGGHSGPQLSQEGAKHDADWIFVQVTDPKRHNPNTQMPGFSGKTSDNDLHEMASYIASLKSDNH